MKTMIQGYSFDITEPYSEGAVIGAVEAKALNQLRSENIGNNQRKAVQTVIDAQPKTTDDKGKEGPAPLSAQQIATLQAEVTKYDGEYTLNMTRGGRTRDPIESMARTIAKALIEKEVKAQGHGSLKTWREKVGDDAYNAKLNEVAGKKKVIDHARRSVEIAL